MKLKTVIISILVVLSLTISAARAEPFKVPSMGETESGTMIVDYKEGGTKWTADWTTEQFTENGENYFKITFEGKGLLYPFSENATWVSESVFKAQGSFYPVSTTSTVKNTRGEIINTDTKTLDLDKGEATFVRKDFIGDDSLNKTFDFKSDTLVVEGVFMALRNLPFESGDDFKAGFLSNEPELYKVEFKQTGN